MRLRGEGASENAAQVAANVAAWVAFVKVVLATSNVGKQRELATLLAPLRLTLCLASEFGIGSAPETGETFAANAEQNARFVTRACGLPALADDLGGWSVFSGA